MGTPSRHKGLMGRFPLTNLSCAGTRARVQRLATPGLGCGSVWVPGPYLEGVTKDEVGSEQLAAPHPQRLPGPGVPVQFLIQGFLGHFIKVDGYREKGRREEQEMGARVRPGSLGGDRQAWVGQAGRPREPPYLGSGS